MRHKEKIRLWSRTIVGAMLVGAVTIALWESAVRPSIRANEAAPSFRSAYPSAQHTSPSPSQRDHGAIASVQIGIDKQMAIATAEALLRTEKLTRLAEAGQPAQKDALAAESYTPRDVVLEADGSQHVRMDRKLRDLPVVGAVLSSIPGRVAYSP